MKPNLHKPSPAMVVACIALFVALGGTGIAAVNFARNAGAVDGKSAVAASSTLSRAAGRLVATNKTGADKGRIPAKFLAGTTAAVTFGASREVTDNAIGANEPLRSLPGIGVLSATCQDQDSRPGLEDPQTTLTFTNTSGTTINMAKRVGGGNAVVLGQPAATVQTLVISGSNSFEFHVQNRNVDLLINGVVRQDGRNTPTGTCVFYGTFVRVG